MLTGVVVLALAFPQVTREAGGEVCAGKTLGRCAGTIEGGVARLALAPVGAPVELQSNLEAIEYRHTGGRDWTLYERPAVSLLKSGHPVAPAGVAADVKVSVNASELDGWILVTVLVTEKGQQTASFTTRFKSPASLQPGADGKRKLVVDLSRNVERPFGAREDLLDELYRQLRIAIGSQREVDEASIQVGRPSTLIATTAVPDGAILADARPAKSCDGVLKADSGDAETELHPYAGALRAQLLFVRQPQPTPTVMLYHNDRVGCHGRSVWVAANRWLDRQLQIRKYDMDGKLQRHLLVEMRALREGEFQTLDEASLVERDGQVEFDLVVQQITGKARRERFRVKL